MRTEIQHMLATDHEKFAARMTEGHLLFGTGDLPAALSSFEAAYDHSRNAQESGEASLMKALVRSRINDWTGRNLRDALYEFEQAKNFAFQAEDEALRYRVERDTISAVIEAHMRSPFGKWLLLRRYDQLAELSAEGFKSLDNTEEYIVSMSYVARYYRVTWRRRKAQELLIWAHDALYDLGKTVDPVNRLNVQIWLMLSSNRQDRRVQEQEAILLIKQTGHTRRYDQLKILKLGGYPLYCFVEWLPSWAQRLGKKLLMG